MDQQVNGATRFDVYQVVTEKIVAAIEAGAGQFHMPWHGDGAAITTPENVHTGMTYRGLNILALWAQAYSAGYASGYWGTYRQWRQVGAQVKKGEHGSIIVFFKRIEGEDSDGQPAERLVARASRVFNADQVEGWTAPEPANPQGTATLYESVAAFAQATKAQITFSGGQAYYHVRDDYIQMPDRDRFMGTPTSSADEALAATLLHELVHWSGAKHRLDRGFDNRSTRAAVAEEELIAELGAAFLCADLGVTNAPRQDHAAYAAAWLKALRNDKRAIFKAASLANKATNYLHEIASAEHQ